MDTLALIAVLLIGLITIALYFFIFRKRVKKNGVLLMGLSESGKTLIFARMAYGEYVDTFTSLKENVDSYQEGNVNVQLIDVPGQERVRGRVFDDFKGSALAIVYVVDSSKVQQDVRDVAEYLHTILCDETVQSIRPHVLVLCNKQDETLSKSGNSIKTLLEKELTLVRSTAAGKSRLDNADTVTLGDPNKPFKFDDLQIKVEFAESSAVVTDEDNGPDLDQLKDWISAL